MSPRSLPPPRTSRKVYNLLVLDGILLFPTGFILLPLLAGPHLPMSFVDRTTIANETNETIYVTGVGGIRGSPGPRYPLTASWSRYLDLPRFYKGEYRLESGSSITFWFRDSKGWGITDALIRDSRNNLYQLPVPARGGDAVAAVSDLSALPVPNPAILQVPRTKTFDGRWIPIAICLAPWLTIVPLLLLYRRQRRQRLAIAPEAIQRWEGASRSEMFRAADRDICGDSSRAGPP